MDRMRKYNQIEPDIFDVLLSLFIEFKKVFGTLSNWWDWYSQWQWVTMIPEKK